MKKLLSALALRCRCCPRVGRHPDRYAVRTGHDLLGLSDHCQGRRFPKVDGVSKLT